MEGGVAILLLLIIVVVGGGIAVVPFVVLPIPRPRCFTRPSPPVRALDRLMLKRLARLGELGLERFGSCYVLRAGGSGSRRRHAGRAEQ